MSVSAVLPNAANRISAHQSGRVLLEPVPARHLVVATGGSTFVDQGWAVIKRNGATMAPRTPPPHHRPRMPGERTPAAGRRPHRVRCVVQSAAPR